MKIALTLLGATMLLGGCTRTITEEVIVEVKVPVAMPCMGERPAPVKPLRDLFTREEWAALTTDQRANLTGAQAIDRMTYGDRMSDAAAGCR